MPQTPLEMLLRIVGHLGGQDELRAFQTLIPFMKTAQWWGFEHVEDAHSLEAGPAEAAVRRLLSRMEVQGVVAPERILAIVLQDLELGDLDRACTLLGERYPKARIECLLLLSSLDQTCFEVALVVQGKEKLFLGESNRSKWIH